MSIAERWKGHPPLPHDLADRLDDVVERLRRGGAQLVYLFGSAASDPAAVEPEETTASSPGDLDLAVWGLEEDRWTVLTDLADILGTDRIDLVLLEEANPELRYRVIADGRLLHAADSEVENRVELAILREYQDMAPFRRTQMRYVHERHADYGP
jgi:hypothetical protein